MAWETLDGVSNSNIGEPKLLLCCVYGSWICCENWLLLEWNDSGLGCLLFCHTGT